MSNKIMPVVGWILICREEIYGNRVGDWHIAWHNHFRTKKSALTFAALNNWQRPYKAVRGELRVLP